MNVRYWGFDEEIDPHNPGQQERRIYTTGQCHALARAIHELTGWQLGVMCHDGGDNPQYDGDHVICFAPNGMAIDIEGLQPLEEIEEQWGMHTIPVDLDTVINLGWDDQDMPPARAVAETILNRVKESPYV